MAIGKWDNIPDDALMQQMGYHPNVFTPSIVSTAPPPPPGQPAATSSTATDASTAADASPAENAEPTSGDGTGPAADGGGAAAFADVSQAVDWFAALLEPLAALAIARGVRLPALIDGLKLALVRAALAEADDPGASDSRLAVMTGVHRKDLRRIRTTGVTARPKGRSLAGQVFARWQADPRYLTTRGRPRVLPRQASDPSQPSFEALVAGISRDVHPRPVLDELVRLRMVETIGPGEARVRLLRHAFVPDADAGQMLQLARDNLADHCAAVAGNLNGGGRRFLEQAIYSDGLTAESARQFNRETLDAWESVFASLMPRLQSLFETDRTSGRPRDHRVRLGMYSLAVPERDTR